MEAGVIPEDELDTYGVDDSRLQMSGMASYTPGMEITGGSLGHGLGIAVGMAMGLKRKASRPRHSAGPDRPLRSRTRSSRAWRPPVDPNSAVRGLIRSAAALVHPFSTNMPTAPATAVACVVSIRIDRRLRKKNRSAPRGTLISAGNGAKIG